MNGVLNLPIRSTSVFILLTDEEPEAVARMIAKLEYHEFGRGLSLDLGDAITTNRGSLSRKPPSPPSCPAHPPSKIRQIRPTRRPFRAAPSHFSSPFR
jgi:hypothetical protein